MEEQNQVSNRLNDGFDELTGLLNLKGILRLLTEHKNISGKTYSVIIYLNVMNFKAFNQQYGFAGGNEFLKGIAQEIQKVFDNDLIARVGGDQFIILAHSMEEESLLKKIKLIQEASHIHEKGLKMRIKAGIYLSTGDESDPVVMVDRAKIACDDIIRLYDKDINFYDDNLKKKNELRQYVIDNFENAFKQKYFKVYYQKEVRALTGKVCGYEALARWIDPKYGMISPAIFVEVLEEVHLVHKLDMYIIEDVCRDLKKDIDYNMAVVPVSVNLSRLDFEICDIKAEIDKCREKYGIPNYLLNIEITESAIASGEDFLGQQIKKFRDDGYQVWMDDFGAGYSSLNNLKVYDFDVLKIDMNFLRSFENNKKSKVILATIVNMAKELGMHTLAEGVETQEQYDFLKRIGCEKLQGYLFGKPTPLEDFVKPDDFTFEKCEDIRYKKYYHEIGELNLLGSAPLKAKDMEVHNDVPIAFMELNGEEMKFIYANDAYIDFLHSVSINGFDEANKRTTGVELAETRTMRKAFAKAESNPNHISDVDVIINGNVVIAKVKFIVREGDKAAFVVVPRNLSVSENEQRLADNIHVAMAHVLGQYFRVDLFDEDGTADNIFLNGAQLPVADVERDTIKAVSKYADLYLYPEERQKFKDFYDMTTVRDRVDKCKRDYLVEYFHSALPGDEGRMQMYMILPFYYNDRWKYISCCRYADEINDEFRQQILQKKD